MTKSLPKLSAQILEEASAWFVDFNEEAVGQAGREEFNAWLRRSPEHVRAFLQVSAFWEDARTFGKQLNRERDELIARAQAEHNVHSLELAAHDRTQRAFSTAEGMAEQEAQKGARERRGMQRRWLATAASIVVATGIGLFVWYAAYRAPAYTTEIGEQRSIVLEDGSSVELNSRSRIKVRFTATQRSVDLLEGQALFTVAKNPARPFVVATGDTHVRAVGTQFDVYRKRTGTVVTVVEGRVAVAPNWTRTRARSTSPARPEHGQGQGATTRQDEELAAAAESSGVNGAGSALHAGAEQLRVGQGEVFLAAGEQILITPTIVELPKLANLAVATAWIDKRLVFESAPLREVVEEFNRYNRRQLVIRDPELYDFHVSGVFPSTDSSRMVEFLRQRFGVTMDSSHDEIEISRREPVETMPGNAPF